MPEAKNIDRATVHRIDRIRCRLHSVDSLARPLQQRCSQLFHGRLRTQLDTVVSEQAHALRHAVWIDRLVLDLGQIPQANFEEQFCQRVVQALSEQLHKWSRAAPAVEPHQTLPIQEGRFSIVSSAVAQDNQRREQKKKRPLTQSPIMSPSLRADAAKEDPFTLLIAYLYTGYVPSTTVWLVPPVQGQPEKSRLNANANANAGPDNWFKTHWAKAPSAWYAALAHGCLQDIPLQRLLQTFSRGTLQHIAQSLVGPTWPLPITHAFATSNSRLDGLYVQLSAWRWFQQHPNEHMPVIQPAILAIDLPAQHTSATLLSWLEPMLGGMSMASPLFQKALPLIQPLWQSKSLREQCASLAPALLDKITLWINGDAKLKEDATAKQETPYANSRSETASKLKKDAATEQETPYSENRLESVPPHKKDTATEEQTSPHAKNRSKFARAQPTSALSKWNTKTTARVEAYSIQTLDTFLVSNAGLVALWPLLLNLLKQLGLVETSCVPGSEEQLGFIDQAARIKAVQCLDWLAWGDEVTAEWRTPLNKFLCGLPLDAPLLPWSALEPEMLELLNTWLAHIPLQSPSLHRCTVQDLRQLFLQRPGQLQKQESRWTLYIEPDASDILLTQLPWPINQLILPWLEQPVPITWI